MENQALISVIIPVYNVEKYLHECVDSVLNQTYKNLEIILVDDGSTDSSGKICDEYIDKDERVTVIHQKNGGLSAARNTGFESSSGDYIYFLDSDDYIAQEAMEKLYGIISKENPDFIFFDSHSFEDSEKGFNIEQRYKRNNVYKTDSGINTLSALQKNKEYHSAVYLMFFSADFLHNAKLCFVPGILYEDIVFTYHAFCKAQKVVQCSESLYFRRYRPGSIMTSNKNKKHFESAAKVYQEVVSYSSDSAVTGIQTAKEYISRCAFNVFNIYEKLNGKEKKECRNKLKEFKQNVIQNNAFGNTALRTRCYGKSFWIAYKIFEKTAGKLLKGKK